MACTPNQRDPMALAVEWVSRITTVALEMIVPGLAGQWLDRRMGTGFWMPIGLLVGFVGGLWHLLRMVDLGPRNRRDDDR